MNTPDVTFILATYNRRDVVLDTVDRILALPDNVSREVIVVDNDSSDGTAGALAQQADAVRLISLNDNLGSCAKAAAVPHAAGRYIVFLDDDSYPRPASLEVMIDHFERDGRLGAAGFAVHLPDGRRECGALPDVFVGCGVGFRTRALREAGGLDGELFMQAEEYDLAFRLVHAGWRVQNFDDLHVDHLKTSRSRISERTMFYDARNNLVIAERYLQEPYRSIYRRDWAQRYRWLAADNGQRPSFVRGFLAAHACASDERQLFASSRLSGESFDSLFRWGEVRERMQELRATGVENAVLADLGKNIYPFLAAARQTGMNVPAIADDRFARPGRRYRGIPIVPLERIATLGPDAIVISNMATVHAAVTHKRLEKAVSFPIHGWFDAAETDSQAHFSSTQPPLTADSTR